MNQFSSREEMRSSDKRDYMVSPKPRRIGAGPVRCILNHQSWLCDSEAGAELYNMILTKGEYGACTQLALSPPFFSGSPPSRVSNPLIHDARFGDENITQISPQSVLIPSNESTISSSSSQRKEGCIRGNFGNKPAVRIEGFDCLDLHTRA